MRWNVTVDSPWESRGPHHEQAGTGLDPMLVAPADVERAVLSRAVRWHLEDRVARHGNTTIVF